MSKTLALAILLQIGTQAHANSVLEHTAINALRIAKQESLVDHHEHGGMLYRMDTPYGPIVEYMEPEDGSLATKSGVRVIDMNKLPVGAKLIATYHVHPCLAGYYHQVFSKTDVIAAFMHGLPEFMLDECSGLVHEFDPHVDKPRDTGIEAEIVGPNGEGITIHLPSGRIIADIGETMTEAEDDDE